MKLWLCSKGTKCESTKIVFEEHQDVVAAVAGWLNRLTFTAIIRHVVLGPIFNSSPRTLELLPDAFQPFHHLGCGGELEVAGLTAFECLLLTHEQMMQTSVRFIHRREVGNEIRVGYVAWKGGWIR